MDTEVQGAVPPTGLLGKSDLELWKVLPGSPTPAVGAEVSTCQQGNTEPGPGGGEAHCHQQPPEEPRGDPLLLLR